ncbi:major allergen Pru ar 1-like [Quercus robur]|uniref:major allergen Pru ar 1-like n=1 Tax=Quercus lobata TaxID=97700 RepID=UPI0012462321|nr:major allergen Pru ar 1-like [Quercus lobata]XP_050239888.1 major allergen Pru ar 1-like [Quercus robur]
MAVLTLTDEFTSPVVPKRVFKALILDADNLMPKLMPQAIKSVETLEGNGGPGTIKKITFAEGSHIKYVKHRTDALDEEKLTYSYTLIEGDDLLDKIESISYEMKFEPTPGGGCKGTNVSKYHPKPGVQINEEEVKAGKEKAMAIYKGVEAYLLANPNVYA